MECNLYYLNSINRVIDYIEEHLQYDLNLSQLADVAGFSMYHFHRIFKAFTGESLYAFILRIRLEKSASILLTRNLSITEVSYLCGFNDTAVFSRAFKKQFGISASKWISDKKSKNHQVRKSNLLHTIPIATELRVEQVRELNLPKMYLAYLRYTGAYAADSKLFASYHKKLMTWAEPLELINYSDTRHIVIYHDSAGITEEEDLRISIGITVPELTAMNGEVGKLCLPEGRFLLSSYKLKNNEYGQAWTDVYRNIIPSRGLQPDEGFCYEMYKNDCYDKDSGLTSVDICVPVKKF